MNEFFIAPSILSADFARLGEKVPLLCDVKPFGREIFVD